jgi:Cu+-exporting ATPase
MAGTIVEDGSIKIFVEKTGAKTILSSMIELVKRSALHKPSIQRLGDKISAIFVPAVILISIITFLLSYFVFDIILPQAIMHSIAVLVISCPCAMGLATPTAVSVGIGRAAKSGILIKGGDTLERLSETETIVFDKTGTLTTGKFAIKSVNYHTEKETADYLLYTLEQYSNHPIANSINEHYSEYSFLKPAVILSDIKEEKGKGITAIDKEGIKYTLGSYKSINRADIESGHQVYLIRGTELLATVDIEDEIREDAKELIEWFKERKIKPIMLSGDSTARCKEVALAIGIEEYYGEQLPTDKTSFIEKLSKGSKVTMIGDGINDAAALSLSNVGIAMGTGAIIAMETSDIVLINERHLSSLKEAFRISALTITTIKQNLFWAFFYNVIAIPVAGIGLLSPMIASLSMAFSDVIVIGNSLRLKIKR